MYFGFGDFLSTNCHLRPVGKPAPPRPRRPDFLTSSMTCVRRHRQRLLQALVALLVLLVVIERVAAGRERVLRQHRLVVRHRLRLAPASWSCPALADALLDARWQPLSALRPSVFMRSTRPPTCSGVQALVPVVVVDHHHRRAIAGAEALHRLDGEHAGRVGFAGLDPQLAARALRSRARRRRARTTASCTPAARTCPPASRWNIT